MTILKPNFPTKKSSQKPTVLFTHYPKKFTHYHYDVKAILVYYNYVHLIYGINATNLLFIQQHKKFFFYSCVRTSLLFSVNFRFYILIFSIMNQPCISTFLMEIWSFAEGAGIYKIIRNIWHFSKTPQLPPLQFIYSNFLLIDGGKIFSDFNQLCRGDWRYRK